MIRLPTWLRAAIITGLQALAGVVLLILADLLFDVQDWVADPTNPVDFSGPAKLVFAAVVSFLTGVVTAVYRYLHPVAKSYPDAIDATATEVSGGPVLEGSVPAQLVYRGQLYRLEPLDLPPRDRGEVSVSLLVIVALVVIAALWCVGIDAPWINP